MTVVSFFLLYWGIQFLLHDACTLTTENTDPRDGNRLKKVSAYSTIDSSKCSVLVEHDSNREEKRKDCSTLLGAQ